MRLLLSAVLLSTAIAGHAAETSSAVSARWAIGGPGGWDYLAFNASKGELFVSRSDRVMVFDATTGKSVGVVPGTEGVHGVAFDRHGKGYTSNGHANSITRFDVTSLAVEQTFPIPAKNPDAILYEPIANEIWTFNGGSGDATAIDPKTGRVVATVALEGHPEFAVTDGHGTIYVNDEEHASIHVIDARKHRVQTTWSLPECEEPSGLALDEQHHRLFSVCSNQQLAVTDATSGRHVASVSIGRGPDAAAYDPMRREILSSNGKDGTLTVIHERDANHFDVEATVATQPSARTMALDPSTHRLYLAAATLEPVNPEAPTQRPKAVPDSFCILTVNLVSAVPKTHS